MHGASAWQVDIVKAAWEWTSMAGWMKLRGGGIFQDIASSGQQWCQLQLPLPRLHRYRCPHLHPSRLYLSICHHVAQAMPCS